VLGRGLGNVNRLLKSPWFQLDIQSRLVATFILCCGLLVHGINVATKFAEGKYVQKVLVSTPLYALFLCGINHDILFKIIGNLNTESSTITFADSI
jgi:hypothetical protein